MGLFSNKGTKLPSYAGATLDQLLANQVWANPIGSAGFAPAKAEFAQVVGSVLVADRGRNFAGGVPFLTAGPAIVIVQSGRAGIAVPDGREVVVIARNAGDGRLMLTQFDAIQVVWGRDASWDGWTFVDHKKSDPAGRALGEALNRWIVSG